MGGNKMSEQTTPETDAATHDLSDYGSPVLCSWGDWVDADFARKLERERDYAREAMREAWLAMDELVDASERIIATNRIINWQNKHANIWEAAK
jgi:hypothetical protein